MTDIICPNCSAQNRPQAKFCTVCGFSFSTVQPTPRPKSGLMAPTQLMSITTPSEADLVMPDGTSFPLQSITVIGRDPSLCHLALPDEKLSRGHAQIEEIAGEWKLTDLNSTNGTYLNGRKVVGAAVLKSGDQIGLGSVIYRFSIAGETSIQSVIPGILAPPRQTGMPVAPAPTGGWRTWKKHPVVEGYVRQISDRYMMKKDDLARRGCIAAFLAIFISPTLAFLPFVQGNEIPARDLRIEDYVTGKMVDVKIIGEAMGNINLGDALAVWAKNLNGLLVMDAAYNYASDMNILIKKK